MCFAWQMQISANTDPTYCTAYHLINLVSPYAMVSMSQTSKSMNEAFGYYLTDTFFKDALTKSLRIKKFDSLFPSNQQTGFFRKLYLQIHNCYGNYIRTDLDQCITSKPTKEMCEFFIAADSEELLSKLTYLIDTCIRANLADNIRLLNNKVWSSLHINRVDTWILDRLTLAVEHRAVHSFETIMELGFLQKLGVESYEKAIALGKLIITTPTSRRLLPKYLRGTRYKLTTELALCIKHNLEAPFTDILTHALSRVPNQVLEDLTKDVYIASKPAFMEVLLELELLRPVSGMDIAHLTVGTTAKLSMLSFLLSMNMILAGSDCVTRAIRCKNPQFVRELHTHGLLVSDIETIQAAMDAGDSEISKLVLGSIGSLQSDLSKVKWGEYGYEITRGILDMSYGDPPPVIDCHIDALRAVLDSTRECAYSEDYLSEQLLHACINGWSDGVKLLLDHGVADPAYRESKCLLSAAAEGHVDIVKMLLDDYRADPLACNEIAIRTAYTRGHMDTVNQLLWDMRTTYTLGTLS